MPTRRQPTSKRVYEQPVDLNLFVTATDVPGKYMNMSLHTILVGLYKAS